MKLSILLCSGLTNATFPLVVILAIARYYIWSVPEANVFIFVLFNMVPGLFIFIFSATLIGM